MNYRFGADLREIPEDAASMQAYVDTLTAQLKLFPAPLPADHVRVAVKFLGEIGAYAKILQKPEVALHALNRSLELIETHRLGMRTWAVHTMRFGDALRFQGEKLAAETAFRSVLEMADRDNDVAELRDFAWQDLGKLFFDHNEFAEAEACFTRALTIRKKTGIKELVDSTELALRVLKMKAPAVAAAKSAAIQKKYPGKK